MRRKYIHELSDWPRFSWRAEAIVGLLADVRHRQGRMIGRMGALGFDLRQEALLQTLTADVVKSSEIEGENLNVEQVRSSMARRLGIDIGALKRADRHVEGVVDMMLDATRNYEQPLTDERLFSWHASSVSDGREAVMTGSRWALGATTRRAHAGRLRSVRQGARPFRSARLHASTSR